MEVIGNGGEGVDWHGSGLDGRRSAEMRAQAHRMLDDMLDFIEGIRDQPVWRPMDAAARAAFQTELPMDPAELATVHADFMRLVLPFGPGNVHPGFMGWVHGAGTIPGMLAEMLAGGLNANCGGRNHAAIEVERQVVQWIRELFGFPEGASGLFVTGTSMASLIALLVSRRAALGPTVRERGLEAAKPQLVAYASAATHSCVARAMDYAGLGSANLRLIPIDENHRISLDALRRAIADDRKADLSPFLVVGNAGTVDIGACDDLAALAEIAAAEDLWFHVDGAVAALGILSPEIAPRLSGIERAQSLALDFHKWAQVPYDAGFILVRDGQRHRDTFATQAAYLRRETRGIAAGEFWPHDYGPDLSRGFRALKTWFTLRVYGTNRLGSMMAGTCRVAKHLERRVSAEPSLELLAPVPLNIVCFRYRGREPDLLNAEIVGDLHESGLSAPSMTRVGDALAIRAAVFNHRTEERDVDTLIDAVLAIGDRLSGKAR